MNKHHDARIRAGFTCQSLSKELREQFPIMSPAVVSLAERSSLSGICYTGKASKEVFKALGLPVAETRTKPCKYTVRLLKRDREAFNAAKTVFGHMTDQQAIEYAIRLYIEKAKGVGL